jgi:integrase
MPKIAKLTKSYVDALQPGLKEYEVQDEKLRAFRVRVMPSGHKSYGVVIRQGRGRGRPQKRETFGSTYQLSCDQARRLAEELVASVRLGKVHLACAPRNQTCDQLFDKFLDTHVRAYLKPRTVKEYERLVRLHLRPAFKSRDVKDVKLSDVQKFHLDFKSTPRQANLMIAILRKAMTLAESWGWRDGMQHPCKGIIQYKERKRDRLLSAGELAAIENILEKGNHHPTVVLAIRLLKSSGCRSDEICRLKWSYIDWDRQQICWPDTKTGKLVKPLNSSLVQLLSVAPRYAGNDHVCPPLGGR